MDPHQADAPLLLCPQCRGGLKVTRFAERIDERCPVCGVEVELLVFPRLFGSPPPPRSPAATEGGAICAYFPGLKAVKVCDECGCLLSEKAAVAWEGGDYCLPCLHRLREERKSTDFVARASLHDHRALALVTWLAPFTLFTAPLAIYLLIRYRKDRSTFVPRGKARWWTALILAIAWIGLWVALILALLWLYLDSIS